MVKEMIIKIHNILNLIKGFSAGYCSALNDKMLIEYGKKRYIVTFKEVCSVEDEEMFTTMRKLSRY